MKSKILYLLAIIALAIGTTSCHDDITPGHETTVSKDGSLNLASLGIEINNAEKVIVSSRATVDLSDFIVDIVDSEGATTKTWKYSQMPELFSLAVGDYTVKVRSHDVQKAAWEEPYFVGEQSFSIKNNEITNIGVVTCKLSNIKVTIGYSDELRAVMGDDCKVVVKVNDEGSLEYAADETRAGYFAAVDGSTTLVAEFTGTVQGNTEHLTFTATDVEGGQHRKITFKLKTQSVTPPEETGSITVDGGINISVETEDENLNGSVKIEEETLPDNDRPGQEEGGNTEPEPDPDQPEETSDITFTCPTASFDEPNAITGEDVIVNIAAVNGIEHLIVTISSTSDSFLQSLSEVGMPTTFDLAYPGDKSEVYASLGLPVGDEVLGATTLDFNISQFVPLLKAFPGTHKFQLSVTDAKSQQLVKTLTFVAE